MLIDLSYNSLTGYIPREICELESLQSLNLSGNQFNGKIPDNIGALRRLESLDLSYNELVGEIPLSLSGNQLNGKIPDNIGALRRLESLDLSYNELVGEIPSSLSCFNCWRFLNLSYNNLLGKIPSVQQLQTLNNLYICTSAILDFADLLFPPTVPWTEQTKLPRMNMTTHHMIYYICTLSLVWRLAFWLWQKYEAIGSGWSGCGYLGHMETINKSCFEKKLPNDPTDLISLACSWTES